MFRPNSAIFRLEIQCQFPLTLYFQPEDGRISPKHVVGELLYLQI